MTTKKTTKMKKNMTHQASSVLYWGGYGFVAIPSSSPPPIPCSPVHIISIKGTYKCDERNRGSYPPPPLSIS